MRILFTIAGLQPEYGGPSVCVPALASALAEAGVAVDLVTCESSPGQPPPKLPPVALVNTRLVSPLNRRTRWRSAGNAFAQCLSAPPQGAAYSVVHDHGLWLPNNHAVAVASHTLGIPRMVGPLGMLTAWSMQHKSWKKQFAWWLYQRRDLRLARLLHATSLDEAEGFRAQGLTQPIAIIPNGVELPFPLRLDRGESDATLAHRMGEGQGVRASGEVSNPSSNAQLSTLNPQHSVRTLLFLGRIHPIKGLLDLIEAWSVLKPRGWRAVLAGYEEPGHRQQLESALRQRGIERDFTFMGPVAGDSKWTLYRQANLFVLPSYSENFGIVVAEALACGVPVITTRGTPWEGLIAHRCGWWTETGSGPLAAALREAMAVDDDERRQMGLRGRAWMEQDFSWQSVAEKMKTVYEWMLGGGVKPECVVWVRNIDH